MAFIAFCRGLIYNIYSTYLIWIHFKSPQTRTFLCYFKVFVENKYIALMTNKITTHILIVPKDVKDLHKSMSCNELMIFPMMGCDLVRRSGYVLVSFLVYMYMEGNCWFSIYALLSVSRLRTPSSVFKVTIWDAFCFRLFTYDQKLLCFFSKSLL